MESPSLLPRRIEPRIAEALLDTPVVLLAGPRQAGKTTLVRHIAAQQGLRYLTLDDGLTLEVNRLCTDGTKNACSFLYGAAARAAKVMGYRKIITYILDTESGVSLRASGWRCAGLAGGREWTGSRRPPEPLYPAQMKYRYEKALR